MKIFSKDYVSFIIGKRKILVFYLILYVSIEVLYILIDISIVKLLIQIVEFYIFISFLTVTKKIINCSMEFNYFELLLSFNSKIAIKTIIAFLLIYIVVYLSVIPWYIYLIIKSGSVENFDTSLIELKNGYFSKFIGYVLYSISVVLLSYIVALIVSNQIKSTKIIIKCFEIIYKTWNVALMSFLYCIIVLSVDYIVSYAEMREALNALAYLVVFFVVSRLMFYVKYEPVADNYME